MSGQGEERFETIVERERGLHRRLSTGQLSMIAIGGAIGTGLFLGSAFAIGFAGPSVLISYAIGAVIALLLMGCLAEMTLAHPTSGSFGAYAEYYIESAGRISGALFVLVGRGVRGGNGGYSGGRLHEVLVSGRARMAVDSGVFSALIIINSVNVECVRQQWSMDFLC